MTTSHTIMPYFHALAVFDVREFSLEGADHAASELFKSLRHPRVLFYEHDTSGGLGPYSPSAAALYFTVIADFDVEAQNEEKAEGLAEVVLEGLSTDEIQFLTFGLVPGDRRVVQQVQPEEARRAERGGREERGGKGRRSRSRGKKREVQREAEGPHEENFVSTPEPEREETVSAGVVESPAAEMHEEVSPGPAPTPPASGEGESLAPAPKAEEEEELKLPVPPPRSSSSMRVTLSVTLHASELVPQTNGSTLPDQYELVALALAEARRRYPELPAELTPESEVVSQPWGDTVLTLTWHYDVPVPSASLEEA